MANRFARRIREGELESVESLKSAFKALAKESHPDLLGPGADGGEFASLRSEYEDALRDFERHRFGARRGRGGPPGEGSVARDRGAGPGDLSGEAWACLGLLLKRGFPKVPRHEKERLRYEYALWRLEEALGGESSEGCGAFRSCEAELLDARAAGSGALGPALGLLAGLVEYREAGVSAMRTELVLALGELGADPRLGPGFAAFSRLLARELGLGGELPA